MEAVDLEHFLHERIPLSKAMGVRVVSLGDDAVVLSAPLTPNVNHRGTVFGGSVSAVAMLASWSLLHARLAATGKDARLVIRRNSVEYLAPVAGDFTAKASLVSAADWPRFLETLERKGKTKIEVAATVEHDGREAASFSGEFVALDPKRLR